MQTPRALALLRTQQPNKELTKYEEQTERNGPRHKASDIVKRSMYPWRCGTVINIAPCQAQSRDCSARAVAESTKPAEERGRHGLAVQRFGEGGSGQVR